MRAAGYIRVSTDEQAREGISLDDQDFRIREYVREQGWTLADVCRDEGVSGSVPFADRPGGAKALAADADCIVVTSGDRIGRDAADMLALYRDHEIISITEAGEPPLLRDLKAVLAQEERRKISQRAQEAAAKLARDGRYNGPRPFGYRFDGGQLVPHPAELPTLRRVFADFIAGQNLSEIVRDLRARNVKTVKGGKWTRETVRGMLRNPVYIGHIRDGSDSREGLHEAVIDKATWNHAQRLLTPRTGTRRGRPTKGSHLFVGGLLRCGICGSAMVPRRPKQGPEHYICNSTNEAGLDACSMASVRRKPIDTAVYRYFETLGLDVEATRRQIAEQLDGRLAELEATLATAEVDEVNAEKRLARVRRDYAEGELPAKDWQSFRDELEPELEAARAKVEQLRRHIETVKDDADTVDAEQDTLERLAAIRKAVAGEVGDADGIQAARAAIRRMFDRFIIHPAENPKLGPQTREEMENWDGPARAPLLDVDEYLIVLDLREDAVEDWPSLFGHPVLKREPLSYADSGTSEKTGRRPPTPHLFGPVRVTLG